MKRFKIVKKIEFWFPVFLWLAVIFLLSSKPSTQTSEIYWQDFVIKKSAHIFEYAVLTVLFYRAIKGSVFNVNRAVVYSILFSIIYGSLDEYHQSFVPGREPAIRDVVFDTIGATLSMYGIWMLLPKAPEKLKAWAKKLQLI